MNLWDLKKTCKCSSLPQILSVETWVLLVGHCEWQATRTRSADNVKEEKHWSQKCNMNWKTWKEAWWILTALCLDRGNKNLAWNGVQWWHGPGRDHRSGIILKQECVHMRACLNKWGVGEMTLINRREQASSLKTLGMWKTPNTLQQSQKSSDAVLKSTLTSSSHRSAIPNLFCTFFMSIFTDQPLRCRR